MNSSDPKPRGSFCGNTRREFFWEAGGSFTGLALSGLLDGNFFANQTHAADGVTGYQNPLAAKLPMFAPKAKSVIFLFMYGGPSHVDTFDYKPALYPLDGKIIKVKTKGRGGERSESRAVGPKWKFKQYGECGKWVSDIFPEVAKCVDDITFVHSMHTDIPEHAGGILMTNLGALQPNRPSMGSWLTYGLGAETENLPGFVAMSPRAQPRGKLANWGNAFLPGAYAGSYVNIQNMKPDAVIRDLKNSNLSREEQRKQADLLTKINKLHLERLEQDQNLEAGIQAMEMAFRMQFSVPEVFDIAKESEETRKLYGESEFAKGCLIARRLVEEGVRVVQLSHSIDGYDIAWDTGHGDIVGGHAKLAKACDQGIAALLKDLEGRGLLDETLVVWGGEFGRAPTSEGKKGRDHDHYGYTTWMAGGGVKKGFSYGATDEFGLSAVEDRVHVHDMNATILHLMGLDHEKLTYRYSGRDYRLTDVHGHVVHDLIA
jgi:hypothetical protein